MSMVLVGDTADAADDWIAARIGTTDVCVTSDIPLASRCLKKAARVVSPTGKQWTEANIGKALAGREIAQHLRELGAITRGPAPLTKGDITVPRRTRYGPSGCIARGDRKLSLFFKAASGGVIRCFLPSRRPRGFAMEGDGFELPVPRTIAFSKMKVAVRK